MNCDHEEEMGSFVFVFHLDTMNTMDSANLEIRRGGRTIACLSIYGRKLSPEETYRTLRRSALRWIQRPTENKHAFH